MISSMGYSLLVIAVVLILTAVQNGVLAEDMMSTDMPSSMPMTTKMPMMNAMKLGDKCDKDEHCEKIMKSECKMMKCVCKTGYVEDSTKMKCSTKNTGAQTVISVSCLALAAMMKILL